MKTTGACLVVFGLVVGVFAFNLDTTVTTEPQNIGGVEIPSQRVNNLGLMDQRRNYLLVAGLTVLVGTILAAAGTLQQLSASLDGASSAVSPMKKCPFCAESIRAEAVVCRYCGRELAQSALDDELSGLYSDCHDAYLQWLAAEESQDFFSRDENAVRRREFLDLFERLVEAARRSGSDTQVHIAQLVVRDYPGLLDDPQLSSAVERLSA